MIIHPEYRICEICKQPRSKRVHSKCSKILQQRSKDPLIQAEREVINQEAKKDALVHSVTTGRLARIKRAANNQK